MRNDFYVGCYDDQVYLAHHGIKGMKWGIRRYQNPDGSYTTAGKQRYGMYLDVNDTSRVNIARIRRGEARRRLDVAKANKKKGKENSYRVAELRARERSARKMVNKMKQVDRGSKLAAKGQTITGNRARVYAAWVGATFVSALGAAYLKQRLGTLGSQGRLRAGHMAAAAAINKWANTGLKTGLYTYTAKKAIDNYYLRSYNASRWNGDTTIKRVGSDEYKDVVDRRKKKK